MACSGLVTQELDLQIPERQSSFTAHFLVWHLPSFKLFSLQASIIAPLLLFS